MRVRLQEDAARKAIADVIAASDTLDRALRDGLPTHVEAGEASNALAAAVIGLSDACADLSVFGQGLAAAAEAALKVIEEFDASVVDDLLPWFSAIEGA